MPYKIDHGSVWALRDKYVESNLYGGSNKVIVEGMLRVTPELITSWYVTYRGIDGGLYQMPETSFRRIFYRLRNK